MPTTPDSCRQPAPTRHGIALRAKLQQEKSVFQLPRRAGSQPAITASGRAHVCPPQRHGHRRRGLDRNRDGWGDAAIAYSEQGVLLQQAIRNNNTPVPAVVGRLSPTTVGSFPPNGYGLYDIIGNVEEWTNDWYNSNQYPFMAK